MKWRLGKDERGRTTFRGVDEERGLTAEVVDVGGRHWWWLSRGPGGQSDGHAPLKTKALRLAERACDALAEVKEEAA